MHDIVLTWAAVHIVRRSIATGRLRDVYIVIAVPSVCLCIATRVRFYGIGTSAAVSEFGATITADGPRSFCIDYVASRTPIKRVAPVLTINVVPAPPAADGVLSTETVKFVALAGALDGIVALRPDARGGVATPLAKTARHFSSVRF
jgi:hypothetical protein